MEWPGRLVIDSLNSFLLFLGYGIGFLAIQIDFNLFFYVSGTR